MTKIILAHKHEQRRFTNAYITQSLQVSKVQRHRNQNSKSKVMLLASPYSHRLRTQYFLPKKIWKWAHSIALRLGYEMRGYMHLVVLSKAVLASQFVYFVCAFCVLHCV